MKGREGLSLKILFTEFENTSKGQIILKGLWVPGTLFLCCCWDWTPRVSLSLHSILGLLGSFPVLFPASDTQSLVQERCSEVVSFLPPSMSSVNPEQPTRLQRWQKGAGPTGQLGGERQIKHPTKSLWTEYQPCIADLGWEPTVYQAPPGLWGMAN